MDRETRKQWLVIACRCDRLEWKAQWQKSQSPAAAPNQTIYWISQVTRYAGPFLPRWWRIGASVLQRLF